MSNISNSMFNIRLLDDLKDQDTVIHRIHPLSKVLTTLIYLLVVVSFDRYAISSLLPLLIYPVVLISLGELPLKPILNRVLLTLPFVLGIGILNPVFDREVFTLGSLTLSKGWITFAVILIKSLLTVSAALILIATTGMDKLAYALRLLKVPRLFVLQLLLTYRYISVLMEEVVRILRAYSLRAPRQKGIHYSTWGSLTGQLILRTFERAQRIYQAMCLRGFKGEYHTGGETRIVGRDLTYLVCWVLFFLLVRVINIPNLLGKLLTGVV